MADVSKQYIISFLASLQGDKLVVSGLKQIDSATKRVTTTTKTATKTTDNYSVAMGRIAKRALLTVPVWFLLRSAMLGVIRTFTEMVRANLQLEEGLARIRTVMQGTADTVDMEMGAIRDRIVNMAIDSRASLQELSEAFYFLKTANLSTEEAMALFEPTVNAMIGTGNSAKDTARAMAGAFNTMAESLDNTLSVTEQAQAIADTLTYTYATQDVQLSELIEGYTKLAPYITGLSDSFQEIVTTLGFLNTQLLRSGRTGRLTGRAILQLTKNSDKLASIFGITFDPDQPINFLDTIGKIADKMDENTQLTARQSEALQEVFATRGGVAVRLLIENFDKLQEAIANAEERAGGFAQKMRDIRMRTVTAQMERMRNILAVLLGDFVAGATGAGDLAEGLERINDALTDLREPIQTIGRAVGWFGQELGKGVNILNRWDEAMTKAVREDRGLAKLNIFGDFIRSWRYLQEDLETTGGVFEPESFEEYIRKQEEAIKRREEEVELLKETRRAEEEITQAKQEANEIRLNTLDKERIQIRHNADLLKQLGASSLEIARYRLQSLENLRDLLTEEEYDLELLKAKNEVIQEEVSFRETLNRKLVEHETELLSIQGIYGSELIKAQMAIEEAVFGRIEETRQIELMLDLEKELTREREAQKRVGAESVNLWKVALRYGTSTARTLARFLQGEISAQALSRRERRIAQRHFRGAYEGALAGEFFFGGGGRNIPIAERPTPVTPEQVTAVQQRIQQRMITIAPTVPVDIQSIININIDSEKLNQRIISAFSKALESKDVVKLIQQKVVEPY